MGNNIVPSNMQYDQVLIDKSNNDESTLYNYQAAEQKPWRNTCLKFLLFSLSKCILTTCTFLTLSKKNKDHDIVCAIAF